MKLKIYLSIMCFSLIFTKAIAQEIPLDIVERVNAVDYIFEGEVISSEPYYTNNNQYIHTSNTVNITKRLKGAIQCGTIEVITVGGTVNSTTLEVSHSLELEVGSKGIFLMDDSNREVSTIDFYPETNPQVLEGTYENQSFIRYWWNGQGINASDLWNNYDSLEQVYNSTEAITGLNFIDCSASAIGTDFEDPRLNEVIDEEVIFPTYSQERFDSLIDYINLKKRFFTRNDRANDKIFYNIENTIVTGTTTKYLEFDVTVKDDYGLGYLDLSAVRIEYDDQVFGNDVVANSNIIVTRGTLNSDPNCYSDPAPSDELNGHTVLITALETVYSQCKAPITTAPQSIMHVKMGFLDCNIPSDIALVDTSTFFSASLIQAYSAYSDFPADTFSTEYDFVEHIQVESVPACKATISDFYPKEIAGGIGDILTIEGFQFGATRGDGNVFFKNADDGGNSEVYLDDLDFVLWSDTLIKIKMPSYDSSSAIGVSQVNNPAGTGFFRILADDGTFDISDTSLKVIFSVYNHSTKNPITIAPWSEMNQELVWHCDSLVANYDNGKMKAVIGKAISDWRCVTGINWRLGNDLNTIVSGTAADTSCIISFSSLGGSALIQTDTWSFPCGSNYVAVESDIRIDSNYTWFSDTTNLAVPVNEIALYTRILHELGHAHLLNHVIDDNGLMHFSTPSASIGVTNLPTDATANLGGNWIMTNTQNTSNASCSSTDNILRLGNPCQQLNIVELNENNSFSIYPNPFSKHLVTAISVNAPLDVSIKLYDITGKEMVSYIRHLENGKNIISSEVELLPEGIYIIKIQSTDNSIDYAKKIVKYD